MRLHLICPALLLAALATPGCNKASDGNKTDSAKESPAQADSKDAAKPLTLAQVKPLFPKEVGGFEIVKIKVKPLAAHSTEYNGTYKPLNGDSGIIKLIINDWRPDGRADWKEQVAIGKETTKGLPSRVEKKGNKITRMVLVAKRFRVDFKSRDFGVDKLDELAKAFDYGALAKLGGPQSK